MIYVILLFSSLAAISETVSEILKDKIWMLINTIVVTSILIVQIFIMSIMFISVYAIKKAN
jgi:hypothetical protein